MGSSKSGSSKIPLAGAALGTMNALTLNHLAFTLGMRINLHRFFQLASILITLLAAGLLCYGVNELIEYLKYSGHS